MNLEKSDLNQFPFVNTKGGIRRLLHPVPHGGSGMNNGVAHKSKIVNDLCAHAMSGRKEQGDLFWMLTHQETQSGILTSFFVKKFVVVRSSTADSNLLQPTEGVNRTPSHVTFSRICMHSQQSRTRDIGSRCLAHVIHVSSACCCCLDTLRPSTLHSSPSLSSSFSFP